MTAAECLAPSWSAAYLGKSRRKTRSFCGALLFVTLFSIVFLPEFPRLAADEPLLPFVKVAVGFRWIDLFLILLVLCHIVGFVALRRRQIGLPRNLALPGLAFLGCIAAAIGYGWRHGGSNFFFDWRGLALGVGLYFVWSFWMQTPSDAATAARVFVVYAGVRIALLFALHVAGRGEVLGGVAIPTFDGPMLSCAVFAALLAFSLREHRLWHKLIFGTIGLTACLFVLLCLRRTYWGELAIGGLILLVLRRRNRARSFALAAAAVAITAILLGSSFSARLQSLDVTQDDTQFSADNADHLYDLIDAWVQVRQSPLMGIGLGTAYPTWHIRNWKPDSVMVHNAPLHVWLKYGLAGLACYLWFHLALLRWLWRQAREARSRNADFLAAAFAYLTAQFVMTLGFAPWPYSELQLTTLMSFIVAAAVVGAESICTALAYDAPHTLCDHSFL